MSLTKQEVRQVAALARLGLTDTEVEAMTAQLGAILDYVDQLRDLDTTGVEELAHPLPISNVFRDDEERPSLAVDESLSSAPARSGDFFGVPTVFDNTEDGEPK